MMVEPESGQRCAGPAGGRCRCASRPLRSIAAQGEAELRGVFERTLTVRALAAGPQGEYRHNSIEQVHTRRSVRAR